MTSRATLARTRRTRLSLTFPFRLRTTDSATYSLGTTSTCRPRFSMAFLVAGPIAAMRKSGADARESLRRERGPEGPLLHGCFRSVVGPRWIVGPGCIDLG